MRAQAQDEVSQISADRPDRAYSLGEEQRMGGCGYQAAVRASQAQVATRRPTRPTWRDDALLPGN